MAVTGKTGADAVYGRIALICGTIKRYRVKLDKVIDDALAAGKITSQEASDAHDFVATANTLCAIFQKIADYSGF